MLPAVDVNLTAFLVPALDLWSFSRTITIHTVNPQHCATVALCIEGTCLCLWEQSTQNNVFWWSSTMCSACSCMCNRGKQTSCHYGNKNCKALRDREPKKSLSVSGSGRVRTEEAKGSGHYSLRLVWDRLIYNSWGTPQSGSSHALVCVCVCLCVCVSCVWGHQEELCCNSPELNKVVNLPLSAVESPRDCPSLSAVPHQPWSDRSPLSFVLEETNALEEANSCDEGGARAAGGGRGGIEQMSSRLVTSATLMSDGLGLTVQSAKCVAAHSDGERPPEPRAPHTLRMSQSYHVCKKRKIKLHRMNENEERAEWKSRKLSSLMLLISLGVFTGPVSWPQNSVTLGSVLKEPCTKGEGCCSTLQRYDGFLVVTVVYFSDLDFLYRRFSSHLFREQMFVWMGKLLCALEQLFIKVHLSLFLCVSVCKNVTLT